MRRRALFLLAGAAVYIGLPYLLVQRLGLGTVRSGRQARRELSLSFDDGPDPDTTPAVLDALKAAGARATFFVVLPQARRHPELLRRMLDEGHEVAPHAVRHVHAWVRPPWDAVTDPVRSVRQLAQLTGQQARLYRPPHGAYTLATVLGLRWAGVAGAHWSVEGGDWRPQATPDTVRRHVLEQAHPGAVVVLHDAGRGARAGVPALPGLLAGLSGRGYRVVPIGELQGAEPLTFRGLPRRAVSWLDGAFDRAGRVRRVGGRHDSLLRAVQLPFPLPGVTLLDGTRLPRGAPVTEFHVNNPLMVDIGVRQTLRAAREDFRRLARELQAEPQGRYSQAVFCLSALQPLLESLGFETHPLPPAAVRRLGVWATLLRRAYGTPIKHPPRPVLSVLSRAAFLALYGA